MRLSQPEVLNAYFPDHDSILDEIDVSDSESIAARKIFIRKYQETDREAVRSICSETGFLGRPIDTIFQDRELFADLLTSPYLDYEPEWSLVAESDEQVIGYLLGSVNSRFGLNVMLCGFNTACKMLIRLMTGKYADHPRSEQFVRWVLTKGLKERPRHPDGAAHLHFNLEQAYRGRTIAMRFWKIYEEMLRSSGVEQYYGEFYSYGRRRPEIIYSRYGLKTFDRCDTTMFQPEISEPVSVICMTKRLSPIQ
jgi:hypothetical protein